MAHIARALTRNWAGRCRLVGGFDESISASFYSIASLFGETLMTTTPSCCSVVSATTGSAVRRPGLLVLAVLCFWTTTAEAVQYDFLSVSGNWPLTGNAASTTFSSNYSNGTIGVSHIFSSPAAVGYADNDNALIYPSQFTTLFPGTGQVQGHLAMTVYGDANNPMPGGNINTSQVIFDLTAYTGFLPDLAFGIWNTTDEVALPAYNIQLLDSSNTIVPPTTFQLIGNQDNQGQVAGRHMMQLNTLTGDITAPTLINAGGTHTDAMFFDGIPVGTKLIVVTAQLPPLNTIGDGVGYYFAEPVPEPSSFVLLAVGLASAGVICSRRRRERGSFHTDSQ
jgi:hypothetical protein